MLFYSTIYPETLQLLKDIQQIDQLNSFVLVGGTALALQIGHRISIDLDLFSTENTTISPIPDLIDHLGDIRIINQTSKILNLFINEIKVDFIAYKYPLLFPTVQIESLNLASIQDIAAMKLAAITGRGSKKDFIDLYFLLDKFTLAELFKLYSSKFPDGNEFLVYKSLIYFEDADIEPMPNMITPINWNEVKNKIILEVRNYFP